MSLLGDITGQVWVLTGTCIFVASAIVLTMLPFSVLRNANPNRGELDQGAAMRLDALQTMSVIYILGGVFGTVVALIIRFLFIPTQAMWSISGLLYLVVAGLATTYLVKATKLIATKEVQMPPATAPASMPIQAAKPSPDMAVVQDRGLVGYIMSGLNNGNTLRTEGARPVEVSRVGFVFGYVATIIVIIVAVILVGVM